MTHRIVSYDAACYEGGQTREEKTMATRRRARRSVLRAVPKRVGKVQAEAEKVLSRGYSATLKALPPGPRKAVRDLTEQLEATAETLSKRGKRTLSVVEKSGKSFATRFERAMGDLDKRRAALLKRVERAFASLDRQRARALKTADKQVRATVASIESGVASVERRAVQAIAPLVRRLEIATHEDLDTLSRRVALLERKLGRRAKLAA
jgi:hypothetical protein